MGPKHLDMKAYRERGGKIYEFLTKSQLGALRSYSVFEAFGVRISVWIPAFLTEIFEGLS